MATRRKNKPTDRNVQQVLDIFAEYEKDHPGAKIDVYRHGSGSIRIRVINPSFRGLDRVDRDTEAWKVLERLPDEVQSEITFLILLTPSETKKSFANLEFEDPVPL